MTDKEIIATAIRRWHEAHKDTAPAIGAAIAHPDDPSIYEAREIDVEAGTITVFYVDQRGQEQIKVFPLHEVFDIHEVSVIVTEITLIEQARNAPLN